MYRSYGALCFNSVVVYHHALSCGTVEYFPVLDSTTPLAKSAIWLPLPAGLQAFVAHVELFSVLQGFYFDFKQTNLAYDRSSEVEWEDRASVG